MTETFPDIEIYIKDPDFASVVAWLKLVFESVDPYIEGKRTLMTLNSSSGSVSCVYLPHAVRGNFASLWFKSGNTPWNTDRDCALAAFAYLNREVRCSTGGWQTNDKNNDESWLRVNGNGESMVSWQS